MDATGRPFLFFLYMAVYAPDNLRPECLLPVTKTLAGTQINSLALVVPLSGVIDLLKFWEREVYFSESLGIFAFQRGCVNKVCATDGLGSRKCG